MPTYQYTCTDCGQPLEAVQRFTDPALTECPTCGGTLRKVFSSVGVVFKGSGFYRTDSRASANGGSGGDSGSKDGAKSGDTAPASTKGSKASANGSGSGSGSGSSNASESFGSVGSSKPASSAA